MVILEIRYPTKSSANEKDFHGRIGGKGTEQVLVKVQEVAGIEMTIPLNVHQGRRGDYVTDFQVIASFA